MKSKRIAFLMVGVLAAWSPAMVQKSAFGELMSCIVFTSFDRILLIFVHREAI